MKLDDKSRLINVGWVFTFLLSVLVTLFTGEMLANRELTIAVLIAVFAATLVIKRLTKRWSARRRPPVAIDGYEGATPVQLASITLATIVRKEWTVEASQRGLLGVKRMRTTWSLVRPPRETYPGTTGERSAWADRPHPTERLVELLPSVAGGAGERQPLASGRGLVLLGDGESGKTATAVLLMLDLLASRTDEDHDVPVPVLFDLASWDENLPLLTWLEQRLTESNVWLKNDEYGENAARLLLENELILPVLDGLDEVRDAPHPADPDSVRADIIDKLSISNLPGFVLTSNREMFDRAEGLGPWLAGAFVVNLDPGSPAEARKFLEGALPAGQLERWREVLTELERRPGASLGAALSSRLMMALAIDVYGPARSRPDTLLTFDDQERIEAHLLHGLIDAVFRRKADGSGVGGHWRSEDARRWLTHLASKTEPHGYLAWWELSKHGGRATRVIAGVIAFLAVFVSVGLAVTVLFNPAIGVPVGGILALGIGAMAARNDPPRPSELELSIREHVRSGFKSGLPIGLIVLAVGTFVRDIWFGLSVGLLFGFVIGTLYALTEADPTPKAVTPRFLLHRDLYVGATYGLAYGIPAGMVGWALSGNVVTSVVLGIACAAAGGLLYGPIWMLALQGSKVGVVAFGHLAIATVWFALQGKLPWRVMTFLHDAHAVGVLRQAGGVYKFRHQRLQEALAEPMAVAPAAARSARRSAEVQPVDDAPARQAGDTAYHEAADNVGDVVLAHEHGGTGDQPAPQGDPEPEPAA